MNRWTVITVLFAVPLIATSWSGSTFGPMFAFFCLAAACHFGARHVAAQEALAVLDPDNLPENVELLDARRDEVSREAADMRRRIKVMQDELENL